LKNLGYRLLKFWIKSGLYFYYGKIKISGLENVPRNKAVLFLPNHQSALLDVLLVAVACNRKPFFLTRSDVFTKPTLKKFFAYLRMIPIYRIRDGRRALKRNQAVFEKCAKIFKNNDAIVMFPEANHNIKRRVRNLSKGFTRILFKALDTHSDLEIHIIPVGLNYLKNDGFPDSVAIFYDSAIPVRRLYDSEDVNSSVNEVKDIVANRLKALTTHIEDEENYDLLVNQLAIKGVDYLNPKKTNETLKTLEISNFKEAPVKSTNFLLDILKAIFAIFNFPILILWRKWAKPKVWEPEFMGTLRFAFALLVYPIYYMALFILLTSIWNLMLAFSVIIGLFLFNWVYVKVA
jgi:1-acyl-sn-glycerol-3-phosphate acyltransferase